MKRKLLLASLLSLSVLALLSIGPDAPADDPGQGAQEPTEAEAAASSEPLESFEPTEKLSADTAVSFPVDI